MNKATISTKEYRFKLTSPYVAYILVACIPRSSVSIQRSTTYQAHLSPACIPISCIHCSTSKSPVVSEHPPLYRASRYPVNSVHPNRMRLPKYLFYKKIRIIHQNIKFEKNCFNDPITIVICN